MSPRLLALVLLTACGSRPPRAAEPLANAPDSTAENAEDSAHPCTLPNVVLAPLSKQELEHEATPPAIEDARALLLGSWDGHAYSIGGDELGQPGTNPQPGERETVCLDARGTQSKLVVDHEEGFVADVLDGEDEPHAPRTDCMPRSRTYTLERDPEAENQLVLTVRIRGGCPDAAGYDKPYTSPYVVHRLDDRFLVLIDGVTGAVTGYRRR